jgi:hypothetical protein
MEAEKQTLRFIVLRVELGFLCRVKTVLHRLNSVLAAIFLFHLLLLLENYWEVLSF